VYQHDATNNNEANNKGPCSSSNHKEANIEADQQTTSPHEEANKEANHLVVKPTGIFT
jgi:hypothetical protein